MPIVEVTARSSGAWTPTSMSTSLRRSTRWVGCSVWSRSPQPRPATTTCRAGSAPSGRWSGSEWKGPAPTAPDSPGTWRHRASWWSRSTGPTVRRVDATASPTSSTPSKPHGPPSRAGQPVRRSRRPATSRRCALLVAKRSARSIRIRTIGQLRHVVITAPDDLRDRLGGLTTKALIRQAAALRPRPGTDPVTHTIKTAMATLARRVQAINAEIAALDARIEALVVATAPALLEVYGVGSDTAAILLTAAGDNPGRIRSEAAWARICGVARSCGSGKTDGRIASTTAATARRTTPSGGSCSPASAKVNPAPSSTCSVVSAKAGPSPRSSARSSATSPRDLPADPTLNSGAPPGHGGGTRPRLP